MAEMDGSVWQTCIAAFHVIPYKARKKLRLAQSLEHWVDITPAKLKELREELQKPTEAGIKDLSFDSVRLHEPTDFELGLPINDSEI